MMVSYNRAIPNSSNLIGFSTINHPYWGIPMFGNLHFYRAVRHAAIDEIPSAEVFRTAALWHGKRPSSWHWQNYAK